MKHQRVSGDAEGYLRRSPPEGPGVVESVVQHASVIDAQTLMHYRHRAVAIDRRRRGEYNWPAGEGYATVFNGFQGRILSTRHPLAIYAQFRGRLRGSNLKCWTFLNVTFTGTYTVDSDCTGTGPWRFTPLERMPVTSSTVNWRNAVISIYLQFSL